MVKIDVGVMTLGAFEVKKCHINLKRKQSDLQNTATNNTQLLRSQLSMTDMVLKS